MPKNAKQKGKKKIKEQVFFNKEKALREPDPFCETYAELAARLSQHYRNPDGTSKLRCDIDKAAVSDWKMGKRLGGNKPLPPAKTRNRLSLDDWIKWFDANIFDEWKIGSGGDGSAGSTVSLSFLREQSERERFEHQRWERERERGRFIEAVEAGRMAGGAMRQLAGYWKNRNEQTMIEASQAKLTALGVPRDTITVHTQWLRLEHQKFTDEAEAKAEAMASEYASELKKATEKWIPR